ncbi:MAG: jacalin-like lectin [Roseateles sp.]|uniref:jacalin-like lectin n=1 Tax=Roseateles sp. TaxID=1971397 RepID=UPI004035C0F5
MLQPIVFFARAALVTLCALTLHLPLHAQGMPQITPSLKKMLLGLPIAQEAKAAIPALVSALEKTPCGGGLIGCYKTRSGNLQLYFFSSTGAQQTFLLVLDQSMAMPALLNPKVQKVLGDTSLQTPIISISTTDYVLAAAKMPAELQAVLRDHYFNVGSLEFASGVQLAARASLGPVMQLVMASMGAKVDNLTLRAAVVMPLPTDLASGAGTGAGLAEAMHHSQTMAKAGADAMSPQAFVEFQFAPDTLLALTVPPALLTDATFFIDNSLTFGYKGNATFPAASGKKVIIQFQTPLSPAGAMDLLDFQFRMATPAQFTMADTSALLQALASPDPRLAKYGGGFIRNIQAYKQALASVTTALSMVQLRNPNPPSDYRFGDPSKPFPTDDKVFNFILLGPLATGGPLIHAAGDAVFMGQPMGAFSGTAGGSGLQGFAMADLGLKLGPLGKVTIEKMTASVDISKNTQSIGLKGNFAGQVVQATLNGSTLAINVPANCVNPFEIKASVTVQASTNIADVFDAQGGANADPSSITGCVGEQLQAALNKIAGDYKNLSGYTAAAATAQLKQINSAAAKAYNDAKDQARNSAQAATNAAMSSFNAAGNAFKKLGPKHHNHAHPDPKFAASVFDWDYYYDNAQDVVRARLDLATHWRDNGFAEKRQGSSVFNAQYYLARYTDVQKNCGSDLQCALQHWVDFGAYQGRQGSAGFSVTNYLAIHADLQSRLGKENYIDAIDDWMNRGEDAGLYGGPASPSTGPVSGPTPAGGGGGSPWSDIDHCANRTQTITGFRIRAGSRVDMVQFAYGNQGWAPAHGDTGSGPYTAAVTLASGEYIVQVNYRSGSAVDSVGFTTNLGKTYGPYGGTGGAPNTYKVTPGEALGCMGGRSGSSIDQLTFSSTGLR